MKSSPIPLMSSYQSYSVTLVATINVAPSSEGRYPNIMIVGDSHKKVVEFEIAC
jgi:hypothetical protein